MLDSLCYGDVVALDGGLCFLEAEGHRDVRLWACETLGNLPSGREGCLFELLPMLQYAARREELLVLAPLGEAPSMRPSAGTDAAVRRLRHRAAAEAAENDRTILAWRGRPVMCGHVVMLRHVRSGKLISLAERALAPLDPSCNLVELVEGGSVHCWLQVEPSSLAQELLPLQPGAPISLMSPTSRQRLRFSPSHHPDAPVNQPRHEVNCSAALGAQWCLLRQHAFSTASDGAASGVVGAPADASAALIVGGPFRLLDAGRAHVLGVREDYLGGDGASDGAPVEMLPLGWEGRRQGATGSLSDEPDAGGGDAVGADEARVGAVGGTGGLAVLSGDECHSGSIWQLHKASLAEAAGAGAVTLGVRYRLFHVATRKFLRAVPREPGATPATTGATATAADPPIATTSADAAAAATFTAVELRLTDSSDGDSTLFYFSAGGGASIDTRVDSLGNGDLGGGGLHGSAAAMHLHPGELAHLRAASGHRLPAVTPAVLAAHRVGDGALLAGAPPTSAFSNGAADGSVAPDDAISLLPVPPEVARDVGRMAALREDLVALLVNRRHLPRPPLMGASALHHLGPMAAPEEVMTAALTQAAAEELMAQEADGDADGGAVGGVDALGRGPAAPLARLLYALSGLPVPSVDEAGELDEMGPAYSSLGRDADVASLGDGAVGGASYDAHGGGGGGACVDRLLSWGGAPDARRQRVLRELGGPALLIRMIYEVLPDTTPALHASRLDEGMPLSGQPGLHTGGASTSVPSLLAARLARLGYAALAMACRNQPASQLVTAQWLPLMITHVPLRVGAAAAVHAILHRNRALLERRVSGDLLRLVRGQLASHGHRPELLAFLRAMCVCDGTPVDTHQVSVCELFWPARMPPSSTLTTPSLAAAAMPTPLLVSLRAAPEGGARLPWAVQPPAHPSDANADADAAAAAAAAAFSIPDATDDVPDTDRVSGRAAMGKDGALEDASLGAAEGEAGDRYIAELIAAEEMPRMGLAGVQVSWAVRADDDAAGGDANFDADVPPSILRPQHYQGAYQGADAWVPLETFAAAELRADADDAFAVGTNPMAPDDTVHAWVLGTGTGDGGVRGPAHAASARAALEAAASERGAYLTEQLLLAAALCEGRNYACLAALQPVYPFKVLMAALTLAHPDDNRTTVDAADAYGESSGDLRDGLYAACGTLLHRLWLDRAPQEPLRLPQLARVWTSLTAPPISPIRPPALQLLLDLVLWLLSAQPTADAVSRPAPAGPADGDVAAGDGDAPALPRHSPLLSAALLRLLGDFMRFGYCAAASDVPNVLRPIGALLTTASCFDGGPPAAPLSLAADGTAAAPASANVFARAVTMAGSLLSPRRVTPRSYVQMIDEDEQEAAATAARAAGPRAGGPIEQRLRFDEPDGDVYDYGARADASSHSALEGGASLSAGGDDDESIESVQARPWLQVQLAAASVLMVLRERHTEALLTRFLAAWRAEVVRETPAADAAAAGNDDPPPLPNAPPPPAAAALFLAALRSDEASPFDAIAISGGPALASALRRLLLSPHRPLASSALRLLMALYGRGHALLSASSQLQLLYGEEAERRLRAQRRAVAMLSSLVEQYELWGALQTAPDSRRMGKCTQLLRALTERCVPPRAPAASAGIGAVTNAGGLTPTTATPLVDAVLDDDDHWVELMEYDRTADAAAAAFPPTRHGSAADEEAQTMLRHLRVDGAILGLLRLPRDGHKPDDVLTTFERERRTLLAATHAFAAAFATANPINARLLFAHIGLILEHANALPASALHTFLAMFRGDRQLCAAAPRELFAVLLRMHSTDGGDDYALAPSGVGAGSGAQRSSIANTRQRLLLALLRPRGFPLRRSADFVLSELMETLKSTGGVTSGLAAATDGLHLPGMEPSSEGYMQRQADVAAAVGVADAARVETLAAAGLREASAARGRWHLHTLQLLAACAHSRSPAAERTCRLLCPLAEVLHAAIDTANPLPLRAALIDVARHVYVESADGLVAGGSPLLTRLVLETAAEVRLPRSLPCSTPLSTAPCFDPTCRPLHCRPHLPTPWFC